MKAAKLAALRRLSLLLLLPGLAGLVISAMISTYYLDTLPRSPAPAEMRMTPRAINGAVVYQTVKENTRLNIIEYSSVGIFVLGLGLGLVYLEKLGSAQSSKDEELDLAEDSQ
jgi:hypothetical protein